MAEEAVFPCVLRILPNPVFNQPNLIVLAVEVVDGIAKVGTPLCIPGKGLADIGKIASIERNHTQVDMATKGQIAVIKIIGSNLDEQKRSREMEDELAMSVITKRSTDLLKANYKNHGMNNSTVEDGKPAKSVLLTQNDRANPGLCGMEAHMGWIESPAS